jgi:DNA-binding transcriptional ArsR family regulator
MPNTIDDTLAALAEPTRRGVIDMLRERPRPAGELAVAFRMSAPAMSRHLRVLRLNGLVEEQHTEREDARLRVYRLRQQPFVQLRQWAEGIEEFWSDQLASFKQHAEAEKRGRRS